MTRTIRRLALAEVQTLLDWAALEGWNPGIHDAPAFLAADPSGFFGAFVGTTMVAGISAVAYDAHFGFIGLYICHPDWRGQGHGNAVWDAGLAYLGSRTIGLDGVPEQQANYARVGFVPAYDSVRMSGTLRADPDAAMLPAARLEDIAALDAQGFPASRAGFLQHWLAPPHRTLVLRQADAAIGYAVVRPCREGSKIGPLFARDSRAAAALLAGLSGPVQIDVPRLQAGWLDTLAGKGLVPGFATTRMYRGTAPTQTMAQVFGITSLELG